MKKIIKNILWPLVLLRRKHDNYLKRTNPEKLFSIYHKRSTGKYLNLDNPQTLYDKIAYMEFRTDTSEWSRLADKVKVREYVEECGYGEYLPKLYGTWGRSADIDFTKLPSAFVIKTNNASATNILVKEKSIIDLNSVRIKLDQWLSIDYGYNTCQPHYSKIKPLILAEEFLVDKKTEQLGKGLIDYKFYCVHGNPMYVFVYTERIPNTHLMKRRIYDMNWIEHPEYSGNRALAGDKVNRPISFEKMQEIAKQLSKPFPFVRVDFYEINNKPIFGEMTFTPGMQAASNLFLEEIGPLVHI